MERFDVIVAGAGLGGLCAAAGLGRAGLKVLVLERDASLASRPQGYRINVNPTGDAALRACLPEPHFELYRDTSHRQSDASVDVFSTDLAALVHRMGAAPQSEPAPAAVDRSLLRAILLDATRRAGQQVRFGCGLAGAVASDHAVRVHLRDGSSVEAGLLVAADGASSTLRGHLLPGHDPLPLGTMAIYGRAPLDTSALAWLPRGVIEQRFVGVTDGAGTTLALGAWIPRRAPEEAARLRVPGLELPAAAPYVMWALLCPADAAPPPGTPAAGLHRFALGAVSGWDPAATQFVREAEVSATFRITLRAAAAVPNWPTGRITFLGDAIHAMSPAGGEGANTAMADAASLVSSITTEGWNGLPGYELDLRRRAQEALARSTNYGRAAAQEVHSHV